MKKLLFLALLTAPLQAHDFWIEPSSFRPARGEAITASLRVGEDFEGDPVIRDGIEIREQYVAYRSPSYAFVELPRAKFDAYVAEEGLRVSPRTDGVQRERYARFAKALLGDAPQAPLGWRFELVPLRGSRFQLLYEGKPLAGALVVAIDRAKHRQDARTDAKGMVTLPLARGQWLVKSVHMIPAPADSGVEWESLWASVTLER